MVQLVDRDTSQQLCPGCGNLRSVRSFYAGSRLCADTCDKLARPRKERPVAKPVAVSDPLGWVPRREMLEQLCIMNSRHEFEKWALVKFALNAPMSDCERWFARGFFDQTVRAAKVRKSIKLNEFGYASP